MGSSTLSAPGGKALDGVSDSFDRITSSLMALAASLADEPRKVWESMGCSEAEYRDYCAGRKVPTQLELERLVELIIQEQGNIVSRNRDLLAQVRAKDAKLDGGETK